MTDDETIRYLLAHARHEGETLEAYRERRKLANAATKARLRGRLIWRGRGGHGFDGTAIRREGER